MSDLTPRFHYADNCAHQLLVKYHIGVLPVRPLDFLAMFPSIVRVCTYSDFMRINNCDREDAINTLSSKDGFTICANGKYVICYNEMQHPLQRVRWTLAHEIGHIALGHLYDNETPYDVLDREADAFACEFLAPALVLYSIGALDADEIQAACDISNSAAMHKSTFLNSIDGYRMHGKTDYELLEEFDSYINNYRYLKKRGKPA